MKRETTFLMWQRPVATLIIIIFLFFIDAHGKVTIDRMKSRDVESYIALQRQEDPMISVPDLCKAVVMNRGESWSICPDTMRLSGVYCFSAIEKDGYIRGVLDGNPEYFMQITNVISAVASNSVPENAFSAMIRLGLVSKFNQKYALDDVVIPSQSVLACRDASAVHSLGLKVVSAVRGQVWALCQDCGYSENELVPCVFLVDKGRSGVCCSSLDGSIEASFLESQPGVISVNFRLVGTCLSALPEKAGVCLYVPFHGIATVDFPIAHHGEYGARVESSRSQRGHGCHSKLPR